MAFGYKFIDEDGNVVKFELVDIVEVDEIEYGLLLPCDEEEQEDDGEPFEEKMERLTSELSEMFVRSHELEDEIKQRLGAIGFDFG